jgi:hypothetical protein
MASEIYYTAYEKLNHLQNLIRTIDDLLPTLEQTALFRKNIPDLIEARDIAKFLMEKGASQVELNSLADGIPLILSPKFDPPLEHSENGDLRAAGWFEKFLVKYEPFAAARQKIREIGYLK